MIPPKICVRVHTNDDRLHRVQWPTEMCVRPNKGDRVLSLCGQHSRKVCDVTHAVSREGDAYLLVEVNK